jgi:hypothetical protein
MQKRWAIVNGTDVVNTVVGGDREFLESLPDYEGMLIVDVTDIEMYPSPYWTYEDGEFKMPDPENDPRAFKGSGTGKLEETVIVEDFVPDTEPIGQV